MITNVKVQGMSGASARKQKIFSSAVKKQGILTTHIHKSKYKNAFITEWTVPDGNFTLPLRSGYTYNCTVDWGDGSPLSTITAWNDADATHTYTAGTYQIKIWGTCQTIYINYGAVRTYLDKVIQWGDVGFTSLERAFYGCTSLTSLPTGTITGADSIIYFTNCFRTCTGLTSIPSGLFDNCTNVTGFEDCFSYDTGITSIPSGLFDNCTLVTTFAHCFYYCSGLTSIPSGLFDNNTLVTTFYGCFDSCTGITTISSGLFDNNTLVTAFISCFAGCTSLTSIPSGLFDNCTAVTAYEYCFLNCISLTGDAPELWNLIPEPTGTDCFDGDTSLTNWDDIPEDWGGDADYSTEFQAILDYWTAQGWALPDDATKTIFDTMVSSLVSAGVWAKMELFNFFSTHNQNCSLTNWANPGTFNPSAVNAPAWAQYQGYTGDSVNVRYVRSNFIPSSDGTLIGQDNICAIIGVGIDQTTGNYSFGVYASSKFCIKARSAANQSLFYCNDGTQKTSVNTNGKKYYTISRGASNNYDSYISLEKTNRVVDSIGLPNYGLLSCGYSSYGTPQPSGDQFRFALLSSYLTESEVTNTINAIETCLDALGTGLM